MGPAATSTTTSTTTCSAPTARSRSTLAARNSKLCCSQRPTWQPLHHNARPDSVGAGVGLSGEWTLGSPAYLLNANKAQQSQVRGRPKRPLPPLHAHQKIVMHLVIFQWPYLRGF